MINGFGSAKEQWFSSFYAAGGSELLPGTACSLTRSAGRCTPPKARIFEYMQARRQEGVDIHDAVYGLACRNFKDEMAELESRIPVNDMEDKQ
uniref:IncF plasmid conjugative transfer pilus assembly protein TraC n=1 Tax=Klebsiella pneumoniae TaxID=573 RepID=A0A8B0SX70_KLEPN|nr:IncF plasmid conjugative transfer pilus assembly protein TraC [Klebsiella pneumoniae]